MDPSSQFIVPTIIDVPELIVTNEDNDYDDTGSFNGGPFGNNGIIMNKLQFLASALSYIIGLGNVWRFPYLCYKHAGGAFILAYSLILLTVGMPLILMEMAFGQYANEGPITIWRISPAFEGIGYAMCLVSATIALYYNIINTWLLNYLMASITFGPLPWTHCDNSWNGEQCFYKPDKLLKGTSNNCTISGSTTITNTSSMTTTPTNNPIDGATTAAVASISVIVNGTNSLSKNNILLVPGNCTSLASSPALSFDKFINSSDEVSLPANEYFHNEVLKLSKTPQQLVGLNWQFIFYLTLVWLSMFVIMLKNLHRPLMSNRQLGLLSLLMPYIVLLTLFTRAVSLDGAQLGIERYFSIDWDRFQNIDIWTDATTQIFFAMNPCWGAIINLANMNKFHENFQANTMLIVVVNYFTSLVVGMACFAIVGHISTYSGIDFKLAADSGIGFIFLVLPEAIAQLPFANINSIIIFGTLLFVGFSSQLTVIETIISTIVDTWPHKLRYRRPLVLMVLCASLLILSLCMFGFQNGFYLIQGILDTFAGTFTAMLIGILELIALAWIYGMDNFLQDIDDMISVHRNLFPSRIYWYFMWRYLAPSVLFAILLFGIVDLPTTSYRDQTIPSWTNQIGWILTIISISVIPIIACIRYMLTPQGTFIDKLSYLCRPSEDWAPSSYVSGPKLINRHEMFDDSDLMLGDRSSQIYGNSSERGGSAAGGDGGVDGNYCSGDDVSTTETSNLSGPRGGLGVKKTSASNGSKRNKDDGVGTVYKSSRKRISTSLSAFRDRRISDNDDDEDDDVDLDDDDDDDSADGDKNNSNDESEPKLVNGKANYIIPEEEDDTDTGLINSETNV